MTRTALALLLALAVPASAVEVVFDFDDVGAPGAFKQIFPGFDNGPTLTYGDAQIVGGVILIDVLFNSAATSGDNILATCDTCVLGDCCPPTTLPGTISGSFATTASSVSLDVINGFGGSPGTFTLTARDAGGAVLDTDSVVAAPAGSPGFVQPLAVAAEGIKTFTVTTDLALGYTFAIDTVVADVAKGEWTDLGSGLAGAAGVPLLEGLGPLTPNSQVGLRLSGALASTTTNLVIGLAQIDAPFKGGVLVPAPTIVVAGLPTDPTGFLLLSSTWPPGVPSGATILFQHWVVDAAGPKGLAASNAVSALTP